MMSRVSLGRIIKLAVSMLVYASIELYKYLLRCVNGATAPTCVVLYYHSISACERKRFARQLDDVIRFASPLNLQDDVKLEPGHNYVAITFDDGFSNYIEQALPELIKRTLPSTNFLIAEALGEHFGREGADESVMTAEAARAVLSPQVQFGSHTLTHPMLPLLSECDMLREIAESRRSLETALGHTVDTFSFPYGGFSERAIEFCAKAGYRRVFTTLPHLAFRSPSDFVVGRVRVDPFDWQLEFRLKLLGAYRWLPWAISLKQALRKIVRIHARRDSSVMCYSRIRKN